jgi:hypothetical protein
VTLQDLGAIGDFVGGIGVIVSLLYLARQIRESSRIERLNATYSVSQAVWSAFDRLDSDPELLRVFAAARDTGEKLTEDDRERLGRFLYRYFGQLSLAYGYAEIAPELRVRYEPLLLRFLQVPAVRGWWSRQRAFFAEPFRSQVDLLIETLDSQ